MEQGPPPREELNEGTPSVPRPAATVVLLRGGTVSLEVLLVRRNPRARFMGGAWVFPGGAVDRGEGSGDMALRTAAIRELAEEAGIELDEPEELVPFARWITPPEVKTRFDTWFYLASAPADAQPRIDGREVVGAEWYEPAQALAAAGRGELPLVFPTIKQLEQLAGYSSAEALLAHTRGRPVHPVQPRVVRSGNETRIVLPREPGYGN